MCVCLSPPLIIGCSIFAAAAQREEREREKRPSCQREINSTHARAHSCTHTDTHTSQYICTQSPLFVCLPFVCSTLVTFQGLSSCKMQCGSIPTHIRVRRAKVKGQKMLMLSCACDHPRRLPFLGLVSVSACAVLLTPFSDILLWGEGTYNRVASFSPSLSPSLPTHALGPSKRPWLGDDREETIEFGSPRTPFPNPTTLI